MRDSLVSGLKHLTFQLSYVRESDKLRSTHVTFADAPLMPKLLSIGHRALQKSNERYY